MDASSGPKLNLKKANWNCLSYCLSKINDFNFSLTTHIVDATNLSIPPFKSNEKTDW